MPKVKKIIDLVSLHPCGKRKMRKAFTLVELAVAVGLLAMMISFASLIFDMSIDTHRMAMANAEIMQKLQAITGQLNADFKGQKISPLGKISFATEQSVIAGNPQDVRSDSIVFFANGDFQSTLQHSNKTVVGNIAIIYYGLADVNAIDPIDPREKVLVRRQTILTSDAGLKYLDLDQAGEYYKSSLSELIVDGSFDVNELMEVQSLNPTEPNDLVTYMAEGVDDFTIQYVGGDTSGKKFNEWRPIDKDINEDWWEKGIDPTAFKFTFTLYDSKGVLKDGKTFTHIVYLD